MRRGRFAELTWVQPCDQFQPYYLRNRLLSRFGIRPSGTLNWKVDTSDEPLQETIQQMIMSGEPVSMVGLLDTIENKGFSLVSSKEGQYAMDDVEPFLSDAASNISVSFRSWWKYRFERVQANQQAVREAPQVDQLVKEITDVKNIVMTVAQRMTALEQVVKKDMSAPQQDAKGQLNRLEVTLATMEERCSQQQEQLADKDEENKRLRGELSDMIRNSTFPFELPQEVQQHAVPQQLLETRLRAPQQGDEKSQGTEGSNSGVSVKTDGPHCFLTTAIFETSSCGQKFFLTGEDLVKGSMVVASDGTLLEVACAPEKRETDTIIEIRAGDAVLSVTGDHRIPACRRGKEELGDVLAHNLELGDRVLVDGVLTDVSVAEKKSFPDKVPILKVVFKPDKPVQVFSRPSTSSSKGNKKKALRRSGMNRRGQPSSSADGQVSFVDTAPGEYED